MSPRTKAIVVAAFVTAFGLSLLNCQRRPDGKVLTLAINLGVEGDALKQAARDYEAQTGVHINIAEFPYTNLFEKELIDLTGLRSSHLPKQMGSIFKVESCFEPTRRREWY